MNNIFDFSVATAWLDGVLTGVMPAWAATLV